MNIQVYQPDGKLLFSALEVPDTFRVPEPGQTWEWESREWANDLTTSRILSGFVAKVSLKSVFCASTKKLDQEYKIYLSAVYRYVVCVTPPARLYTVTARVAT